MDKRRPRLEMEKMKILFDVVHRSKNQPLEP